jgi:hypothetical protein
VNAVAFLSQGEDGFLDAIFLDEDVVGVEGGYREEADAGAREGRRQGDEHSHGGELDGAVQLEGAPASLLPDARGNMLRQADDAQLVRGARDTKKWALAGPFGNLCGRLQPAD